MTEREERKVVIIGGGPAGLTAALYASRAMLDPLVLEGAVEPGGQLTTTTDVDNFPGYPEGVMGPQLIDDMRAQCTRFGAEIRSAWVESVDLSARPFTLQTDNGPIVTETLIIATGASAKYLGIAGENEFLGKGVSACATCDGFFFRDQEVMVIGGGDTAMEEATFLTRFASKVYIVHRREELRASKIMQQRAFDNDKIEFVWNTVATEVHGNDQGVTHVTLQDTQSGEQREQPIQGFFLGIGHKPNTDLFKGVLDMDESGYLITQPNTSLTNVAGVFAAGDVHDNRYRQAITAAGAGCRAAMDAEKFLEEHGG